MKRLTRQWRFQHLLQLSYWRKPMTLKDDYKKLKFEILDLYYPGAVCPVCLKKFTLKRLPVFHHKWYNKRDVVHSDYCKSLRCSIAYHRDLSMEIARNRKRFIPLCNRCHQSVSRLSYYKKDKLARLLKIVKQTKA